MTAGWHLTYTLDNSNPGVQALNDGVSLVDTFTVLLGGWHGQGGEHHHQRCH